MNPEPGYPGTPRWVKVAGAIALVVILLLLVLFLVRGPGGHGPGRHFSTTGWALTDART